MLWDCLAARELLSQAVGLFSRQGTANRLWDCLADRELLPQVVGLFGSQGTATTRLGTMDHVQLLFVCVCVLVVIVCRDGSWYGFLWSFCIVGCIYCACYHN